ncbi:hypothetical protein [Xanthomonas vasicola]|nr:hypothetical protein [Xanthomonas vasicola]MBV6746198.1 hypothetical protein [Xanthomonas vasicola pv. vasculorum NCPPB 890]MBV6891195.1 hypothetical protein [Xanthomonas vasicola pv. vasculorum]MBV7305103.1 hypothetical protein [Xanthomonas vasicola pv. vasculorum]MDO6933623.1 hypothetical protein [Xanthomonas vasicola]MDO6937253.1 hypothetical protein [Xanthomonas vasicola]
MTPNQSKQTDAQSNYFKQSLENNRFQSFLLRRGSAEVLKIRVLVNL